MQGARGRIRYRGARSIRTAPILLALTLTAGTTTGCTIGRMQGFDTLAATPGLEAISLSGLPFADSGHVRLGSASGSVAWREGRNAIGWGPDGIGSPADQVRVGQVARFGVYAFDLDGDPVRPGHLEARCRYGRTENRGQLSSIEIVTPGRPLRLQCAYRVDGRDAGMLELAAAPSQASPIEPRAGLMRFDGHALIVQSDHAMDGVGTRTDSPMGYRVTTPEGRIVAVVETNGWRSRRLLLSTDPAERPAAVAAALSLALFHDPGDTD